jgi:hypothetical protein
MTQAEQERILAAFHGLELAVVERLARLEALMDGHRELKKRVDDLESKCDVNEHVFADRTNRLLVGLVIVAIIAFGDGALRIVTLM